MDLKDLGKSFASLGLKVLGTAVGGPAGTAVADMVGHVLGLDSSAPDAIATAVAADPQAALKLKQFELDHALELQKLVLQEQSLWLSDVQSARTREVETTKATGKRDLNLFALAWVIMGGFIGLIGCLIVLQVVYKSIIQSDPLISLLVGSLSTDAGMVVGYFFGSSKGADESTRILAQTDAIKGSVK